MKKKKDQSEISQIKVILGKEASVFIYSCPFKTFGGQKSFLTQYQLKICQRYVWELMIDQTEEKQLQKIMGKEKQTVRKNEKNNIKNKKLHRGTGISINIH